MAASAARRFNPVIASMVDRLTFATIDPRNTRGVKACTTN
jgi:hypothetical protein